MKDIEKEISDVLKELNILGFQSRGGYSTVKMNKAIAQAKSRLDKIYLELGLSKIDRCKTGICDTPDMDGDGTPTNRCGGCFPCVKDQIIDEIHNRFEEGVK